LAKEAALGGDIEHHMEELSRMEVMVVMNRAGFAGGSNS